jgi:hypothetical protein
MNYEDARLQQQQILEGIYCCKDAVEIKVFDGVLQNILNYSAEDISYVMGDFGIGLRSLALLIDLSHPDLAAIHGGQLVGTKQGSFSRIVSDAIKTLVFCKHWGACDGVVYAIRKVINQHELSPTLSRVVNAPNNNQLHVRFVPSRENRERIRAWKRHQVVGLGTLYSKGNQLWHQCESTFENFYRHNLYARDIQESSNRMRIMAENGLVSIADEMKKFIEELKQKALQETYFGFSKIPLVTAAIILAKMHGYEFDEKGGYGWSSCGTDMVAFARPSKFDYRFFDDVLNEESKSYDKIEYYPRIYTLKEMVDTASDEMKKLVDHLESFPEIGGKALFDHYRILVPGLNYPSMFQRTPYHFKLPSGESAVFDELQQATIALDRMMIQEKAMLGVLLGERDGEHYFVSYWM